MAETSTTATSGRRHRPDWQRREVRASPKMVARRVTTDDHAVLKRFAEANGTAIAEMIASMSKPSVSVVLGGGHSIGVPIATSATYSFIVESATMTIHPIRLTGLVIGAQSSFDYLEKMQDRVNKFVTVHSGISEKKWKELLYKTGELSRDIGTSVVGGDAVQMGLINGVGGVSQALNKLRELIRANKEAGRGLKQ